MIAHDSVVFFRMLMLNSEKFFVHHIIETHHLQSDSPRLAPRPILCLTLSHGCSSIESIKDDISKPPPVVEDGNEKAECNVSLTRFGGYRWGLRF